MEVSKERLQQMHRDNLLLLGSIAESEKRLADLKLEAQQLNCAIMDELENKDG